MAGLKRKELLQLEMRGVDMVGGTILIRNGKRAWDRIVPLHPRLEPALQRYFGEKYRTQKQSPWAFSSLRSESRLTEKNLYAILRQLAESSGISFTPHMLRHTFGRELVEADLNVYELKEFMGHSNVPTTQLNVALSQESLREQLLRNEDLLTHSSE